MSRSTAPSPRRASVTSGARPCGPRCVERRRVELDELDVGQRGAGAQGERPAVGGGHVGVGRRLVEPADAAGREQDRGRRQPSRAPVRVADLQALHGAVRAREHGRRRVAGEHGQPGAVAGGEQGALHLGAGRVPAGVHDAQRRVPALAGAGEARGGSVEDRALGPQPRDGGRARGEDLRGGVGVDQPAAGGERVGEVGVDGVVRDVPEHHGDAALGPARAPGVRRVLGDHDDAQAATLRRQRRGQPGDAGADDDEVGGGLPADGPAPLSACPPDRCASRPLTPRLRAARSRSSAGRRRGRARPSRGRRGPRRAPRAAPGSGHPA